MSTPNPMGNYRLSEFPDGADWTVDERNEFVAAHLAGEFLDRWRLGEPVSLDEYLEMVPEGYEQPFIEVINVSRFLTVKEGVEWTCSGKEVSSPHDHQKSG